MSLRLVIESTPITQPQPEMRFEAGELVIGRDEGCDWPIADPKLYVSRRHCVISGGPAGYSVTDLSKGGLFLDDAGTPLGRGQVAPLSGGMRLRLGQVVIRVEAEAPQPLPPGSGAGAWWTAVAAPELPAAHRAAPVDGPRPAAGAKDWFDMAGEATADPPPPAAPKRMGEAGRDPAPRAPAKMPDADLGLNNDSFFNEPGDGARPAPLAAQAEPGQARMQDFDDDIPLLAAAAPGPTSYGAEAPPRPEQAFALPSPPSGRANSGAGPGEALPSAAASDLVAALYRGLGLEPPALPPAPEEIEALGRRFRMLTEGLVQLLRDRAREKQNLRVAVTVHGARDVNPLKTLPGPGEAVAALVRPRGPGYLAPEAAITGAYRDLADHQLRSWTALQGSLRRMIDRFDPARFEAEAAQGALLEALLAGGRSARLWQLYGERYRTMAAAAEDRFLGEIGADFRSAYEGGNKGER